MTIICLALYHTHCLWQLHVIKCYLNHGGVLLCAHDIRKLAIINLFTQVSLER
jgi:hypothetical protein